MSLVVSPSKVFRVAEVILEGGIAFAPTDTIYGLLANALDRRAVERLFAIRRPSGRPFLLLIPQEDWIEELGLIIGPRQRKLLSLGITLVIPKRTSVPLYLTRGRKSLAVRLPSSTAGFIRDLLKVVGVPLVAPSANPEGLKPATSVKEGMAYFGRRVNIYVDAGKIVGKPSTIVRLIGYRSVRLVREGNVPFREVLRFLSS
ncbi:Sua5/YciO/YrdC/YwlC family protein [Thermocrinis albus DSM 14484]|uniref:L-threonylcarbamoyladenylate synthase n=1 Tax=Thermocrinis albus (strain DSM 14484 / JCM 11386 / HI 11/12) TaxID=638303 RepID=D3SNW1_THEAH|nr:L-threonylcarbamoyladenylate synthase [Thermocrinis albus]ADC88848.1 Sua5/YciO/YrdC/YwlC family protein [Thermocrinis albus DSM 14484]